MEVQHINFAELLNYLPYNAEVQSAAAKANERLTHRGDDWKAMCAISGGSDSDILLDLVWHVDDDKKIDYVFYDTGVEYDATKRHLEALEQKYDIKIHREKAVKSIPTCCKEYGIPWLTKRVSDYIGRLQKHNFRWEDEPYETLIVRYPHCETALKWWCNVYPRNKNGSQSRFNIAYHKLLKEYIMTNPPSFKISYKCCHYAKKLVAERFRRKFGYKMEIVGVRQAENGVRSQAYKNCFTPAGEGNREYDQYRPIWWLTDDDKREYKEHCGIRHSDCYEVYGLKRTGCVGCPFSSRFEDELAVIQKYEPKLYMFCVNVFGPSYEYYRGYRRFKNEYDKQARCSNGDTTAVS